MSKDLGECEAWDILEQSLVKGEKQEPRDKVRLAPDFLRSQFYSVSLLPHTQA